MWLLRTRSLLVIALLLVPLARPQRSRAEDHALTMPPASLDQRTPLPLPAMMAEHQKQNMREHLIAIQGIVAAIGRDDMDGVAKAASRIGYSETMGQMCEHMGAAAPGFTPLALTFHHTADTIGEDGPARRPCGRVEGTRPNASSLRRLPRHVSARGRRRGDVAPSHDSCCAFRIIRHIPVSGTSHLCGQRRAFLLSTRNVESRVKLPA